MVGLDLTAAEEAVANVSSSAVRSAAQAALNLAQTTGNQSLVNAVQKVLGLSAAGNGTAIFYSRLQDDGSNYDKAIACRRDLTPQNSYIFPDTAAKEDGGNPRDSLMSKRNTAMQHSTDKVDLPTVTFDGAVQTWDDRRRSVAKLEGLGHTYWFTWDIKFDGKSSDFWVVIQYFGFKSRGAAGSENGQYRESFSAYELSIIKQSIREFFESPEEKNVFPFNMSKIDMKERRILGVLLAEGWSLLRA